MNETAGQKILIVDDVPANLLALEATLEPLGVPVVRAGSGEAALKRVSEDDFACVLLDVQMPGLDGFATARLIRSAEKTRRLPIIFITAINTEEAHVLRGYAEGAVDYLAKPFSPEILCSKVSAILELDAQQRAARAEAATLQARLIRQEQQIRAAEQQALVRAEAERARLYALFMQVPFPIVVLQGEALVFDFINPKAAELLDNRYVFGRAAETALPPELWTRYFAPAKDVWRMGKPRFESGVEVGTSAPARYDFLYQPLLNDTGAATGVLLCAFDVSAQVRAREEAEAAVRVRDDFFHVASHEMKGPLIPLVMRLDILARQGEGLTPHGSEMLNSARRHARRAITLVESLLDVSRVTAGTLQVDPQPNVDVAAVLRDVMARHEDQAKELGAQLTVEGPQAVLCTTDSLRLEQVLSNLISNALKYGRGKPVLLRLEERGSRIRLSVADHGMGISPDAQKRIFEKFDRAGAPAGTTGLGLGLYITQQLVQALGGNIHVESKPGAGSLFVVDLPSAPSLH